MDRWMYNVFGWMDGWMDKLFGSVDDGWIEYLDGWMGV